MVKWRRPSDRRVPANDGFFVTYDSSIDEGEFELEYGVTSRLATEFMAETFQDFETGQRKFTGFRWKNRARLFERDVPLNPMLHVEYEDLDPLSEPLAGAPNVPRDGGVLVQLVTPPSPAGRGGRP